MQQPRLVCVAGGGTAADRALATNAQLLEPFAIDFDPSNNMLIAEMMAHRIRLVTPDGRISTLAGNGQPGPGGDNGPAANAQLHGLHDICFHPDGTLYIADTWNARVRKIDRRTGIITTVAGTGTKGFSGDEGPAAQAQIGDAYAIAFNAAGSLLYLADLDNLRVRMIDIESGIITTVAGNGQKGVPQDNALAVDQPLMSPRAVAVDPSGILFIVERGGHAVRKVDSDGLISTIIGTGEPGYSGDEGPARQAKLLGPKHLVVDPEGNLILADTENHVIRKYSPNDGRIIHLAGTGQEGAGDFALNRPHGVRVDRQGTLHIADSYNHRIVRVETF
jgi:DNA-binding beta-propeller fold protein YncE